MTQQGKNLDFDMLALASMAAPTAAAAAIIVNNYDNSRTINQTNNSPKALSRLEIYRQTKMFE